MPVDIFGVPEFVAALKAAIPGVQWEALGVLDNEHCFRAFPVEGKPFAVLVSSSIGRNGQSDAACEDSIRAFVVTEEGAYWGGKFRRWVSRVTGWERRTADMLQALAGQIERINPCPACGEMVKPFTAKKPGPNKGRPFVKCCNDNCKGVGGRAYFQWTDEEEQPQPQAANRPNDSDPTDCPRCGCKGTLRRSKFDDGPPFYCANRYNRAINCRYTGDGMPDKAAPVPQDERKPAQPTQPPAKRSIGLNEAKRLQAEMAHDGSEAAAMGRTLGAVEGLTPPPPPRPKSATAGRVPGFHYAPTDLVAHVRRIIAGLEAEEFTAEEGADELRRLLD